MAFAAWVSHPFEFGLDASNAIADGAVTIETARPAHDWVITLEKQLDPFGPPLNLLYVVWMCCY